MNALQSDKLVRKKRKPSGIRLQQWIEKKQLEKGIEKDERRLRQRQKQIDNGKNTIGYQRYCSLVPKEERRLEHPFTPLKYQKCSKRSWDGQIRRWRRMLHQYDPPTQENPEILELFSKLQNNWDQGTEANNSITITFNERSKRIVARSIFDDFEGK
ncbi:hypothetical protein GpartN1_g2426.t1 [Galdieria partita]|uniref:Histone RNA hairpin-binding protein RNA-binding domain-containing protein n=1 Tax=Galdieria partita TaxID=83374 RepID=A0A9C7PUM5_9RHOD|nr:hypothetical protein GpartN1_g2426.t1 [Galdieria partita]